MDLTNSQILYTGLFLLFILLSGLWVSRSGKPYNSLIFNIHKLIGLAAGIYLIRTVYLTNQATSLKAAQWTSILITVLLFLITVFPDRSSLACPVKSLLFWGYICQGYSLLITCHSHLER